MRMVYTYVYVCIQFMCICIYIYIYTYGEREREIIYHISYTMLCITSYTSYSMSCRVMSYHIMSV